MTKPFVDHFGAVSSHYADTRPTYPLALYEWLSTLCDRSDVVWDCGAGSGQASRALADYFGHIIATDASAKQIGQAEPHQKIEYRVASAEESGLAGGSVDLVTVAQALHWFDFDRFFSEVNRVLKPEGILAVWSYGRQLIQGHEVNEVFQRFYSEIVGPYWPPERLYVEQGYRSIQFPFPLIDAPPFEMKVGWEMGQLVSYVRSWSATASFIKATGVDPVPEFEAELGAVWGDPAVVRSVEWPLTVLVGKKPK